MKTIIAGSRGIQSYPLIAEAVKASGFEVTVVFSGHARGVDRDGEQWARDNGVPLAIYPAYWREFGKSAGSRRNEKMAQDADALIALWDGESKGTAHMVATAKRYGLAVCVCRVDPADQSMILSVERFVRRSGNAK